MSDIDYLRQKFNDDRTVLRQSLIEGMNRNPDKSAVALKYANDRMIPLDMAERNLDELEKARLIQEVGDKAEEIPALAKFMSERENAAIAHDDVGYLHSVVNAVSGGFMQGMEQIPDMTEATYDAVRYASGIADDSDMPAVPGEKKDAQEKRVPFDTYEQAYKEGKGIIGTAKNISLKAAGDIGQGLASSSPSIVLGVAGGIAGAASSGPIGGSVGGASGALIGSGSQNIGEFFSELKGAVEEYNADPANVNKITNRQIGKKALAWGAGLSVPDALVPGKVAKGITKAAIKNAVSVAIKDLAAEAGKGFAIETGTEAIQQAGQIVGVNTAVEKPVFTKENFKEVMEAGLAGGFGGAGMVVGGKGIEGAISTAKNTKNVLGTVKGKILDPNGKLLKRSPEKMRELLNRVNENKDMFIDGEAANTLYQSLSPEEQEAIRTSVPYFVDRMQEAVASKSDMIINRADYMTYVQPKDTESFLDDNAKFMPEHSTAKEAAEYDDFMQQLYEGVVADPKDATDAGAVEQNIFTQLLQKFGTRIRPSGKVDVAKTLAYDPRKFYETMSSRIENLPEGVKQKAYEVMNGLIRDVTITRPLPEDFGRFSKRDDFTLLIDRARNKVMADAKKEAARGTDLLGDKKKKREVNTGPKPVMQWLEKKGGVVPGSVLAKELSAMDITPSNRPKLFSKTGTISDVDNLPASEFNDEMSDRNLSAKDDGNGYVDRNWLIEQIRDESFGRGARTEEQMVSEQDAAYIADLINIMEQSGIDIENMSTPEIKKRLDEMAADIRDGQSYGDVFYQNGVADTGLRSALVDAVSNLKQEKGSGEQILGILKNIPGVKEEEIAWTGLDEFLKGKKSVTKSEVEKYLADNQVQIEEVTLGKGERRDLSIVNNGDFTFNVIDGNGNIVRENLSQSSADDFVDNQWDGKGETKFSQYTLPGGENYREVLLTLPEKKESFEEYSYRYKKEFPLVPDIMIRGYYDSERIPDQGYKSSHFDKKNILAHIRLNDRTDADGKKVLFIEEIQSDWHQAGRKKGYRFTEDERLKLDARRSEIINKGKSATQEEQKEFSDIENKLYKNGNAVPDAPFKKSWHEMAFRRAVQMAAEQGYDRVAWTTGEQQAERYDMSQQVDYIKSELNPMNSEQRYIDISTPKALISLTVDNKGDVINQKGTQGIAEFSGKNLEDIIGKELSKKVMDSDGIRRIEGEELKIGGEGMKGFYDNIIPKYAEKFGKKFGAKVSDTKIGLGDYKFNGKYGIDERVGGGGYRAEFNREGIWFDTLEEAKDWLDSKVGNTVHSIEITDEMRKSAKDFVLFQNDGQGPRGSIEFQGNMKAVIRLFENENLSTVLHELSHLYMKTITELAKIEGMDPLIIKDVNTLRTWAGAKELSSGEALTVEQEEKIADGYLAFLREGKAPSVDLQESYNRYSRWLVRIYRGIKDSLPKINKEVKDVFDRMFATQEEIDALRGRPIFSFDEQIKEFIPAADYNRFKAKTQRAMDKAQQDIMKKSLRQAEKRNTQEYRADRAALTKEVEQSVNQERLYLGISKIENAGGISRKLLQKQFGKEVFPYLSGKGKIVAGKDGIHPDVAADIAGYSNISELISEIMNAESRQDKINRLVEEEMLARYGDMLFDGTIENEAVISAHNDIRADVLEMELKTLAKLAKMPAPTKEAIKARALQVVSETPVKNLIPYRRLRAENKAFFEYGKAMGQKEYAKAATAKAQQLLNHYLYKHETEAKNTVSKAMKQFRRYAKQDKKIAESKVRNIDYVYAIRAILAKYGIGRSNYDFVTWYNQLAAENPETAAALSDLINTQTMDVKPYKELSFNEFLGLRDAVDGIDDMSKNIMNIEIDGKRMLRNEAIDAAVDSIYKNNKVNFDSRKKYETFLEKMGGSVRKFNREAIRIEYIFREMDKDVNGTLGRMFMNPLAAAERKEIEYTKLYADKLKAILEKNEGVGGRWENKVYDPKTGLKLTVKNVITMALNMGNEQNIQRLVDGENVDKSKSPVEFDDIKRIVFDNLTKEDMDTVAEIWKMFEELRPDLQREHKKITGFPMEVVKAQPLETPWGVYDGGYFPIVYDKRSSAVRENDTSVTDESFSIPSVNKGMTKSRKKTVNAGLLLDFETILSTHFRKTIHLVTHGAVIKDLNSIMNNAKFKEAFVETQGIETYSELRPWLAAVASNTVYDGPVGVTDKIIRHLRVNTSKMFMAFGVSTGIKQTLGLVTAYNEISRGGLSHKNYLKGMAKYLENPSEAIDFIFENSNEMQGRINKLNADIASVMSTASKLKDLQDKIDYVGMSFIGIPQVYMVDMPTWYMGYLEGMERHNDHKRAVGYADALLRQTQGSGSVKDLAKVQRGSESQRAIATMFGTYTLGVLYPRMREIGIDVGNGNIFRAVTSLMSLIVVPAVLEGMMSEPPEDDENYAEWVMLKSSVYGLSSIPVFGDIITAALPGQFGYSVTAVETPIKSMIAAFKSGIKNEDADSLIKSGVIATGLLTGLPVYKPYKVVDELIKQASGEEEVNPLEILGIRRDK